MSIRISFETWELLTAILPFQLGLSKIGFLALLIIVIAILIRAMIKKLKKTKAGL
jgi:hypothetical protein